MLSEIAIVSSISQILLFYDLKFIFFFSYYSYIYIYIYIFYLFVNILRLKMSTRKHKTFFKNRIENLLEF